VLRILVNPVYAGVRAGDVHAHPPIVSRRTWEAVQAALTAAEREAAAVRSERDRATAQLQACTAELERHRSKIRVWTSMKLARDLPDWSDNVDEGHDAATLAKVRALQAAAAELGCMVTRGQSPGRIPPARRREAQHAPEGEEGARLPARLNQ
jgi:hypothetical protein